MSKDIVTQNALPLAEFSAVPPREEHVDTDTSLQKYVWFGGLMIALLMGGLGGWSLLAQVSGAVVASGTVTVESSRQSVQHPDGGVISELLVKAGDQVKAGQLLARLDGTIDGADLNAVVKQLDELKARRARLNAEAENADHIAFPASFADRQTEPELRRVMGGQQTLFEARRDAKASQQALLEQRVLRFEKEASGVEAQRDSEVAQLALYEKELSALKKLYDKGYVALTRVLALEREAARVNSTIAGRDAEIARAQNGADEVRLQIIRENRSAQEAALLELRDVEARIAVLDERRIAAAERFKRVDIRAPQSGTVLALNVGTVGGVVRPGETLMEIVPNGDDLVIEARVPLETINKVAAGSRSTVRLSALDQQSTPELTGEVTWVSADSVADERTGARHYLARISLASEPAAENLDLVPGMPAEVFIQTSARSPMSYLLKPLTDNFARTFREG